MIVVWAGKAAIFAAFPAQTAIMGQVDGALPGSAERTSGAVAMSNHLRRMLDELTGPSSTSAVARIRAGIQL